MFTVPFTLVWLVRVSAWPLEGRAAREDRFQKYCVCHNIYHLRHRLPWVQPSQIPATTRPFQLQNTQLDLANPDLITCRTECNTFNVQYIVFCIRKHRKHNINVHTGTTDSGCSWSLVYLLWYTAHQYVSGGMSSCAHASGALISM